MDNDAKVINLGLDFDAREFMQFLEDEAVASYREGYAAGKKAEKEARRVFWRNVRNEVACTATVGIFFALGFIAWVSR